MLRIVFTLFIALIFSLSLKSQQKLSVRQEKLEIYLKKYRTAIEKAPDSLTKLKVFSEMWNRHMRFIQDTLKFSTYPSRTIDTFYFDKVNVKRKEYNNKVIFDVILENKYYSSISSLAFVKTPNLKDMLPLYGMLSNINQNKPVIALINLQDLFIGDTNLDKGIKKIYLSLSFDSIYNTK